MAKYSFDSHKNEDVELDLDIKHETANAYLVSDSDKEVWIPKSQVVELDNKSAANRPSRFVIPHWVALDRGLI